MAAPIINSSVLVPAPGKDRHRVPLLLRPIMILSILSFLPFLVLFDLIIWQYQAIYFGFYRIPKFKRSDFVVIDRHRLSQLNIFQKFSCVYCGYANGIAALAKAVAAQTELYSCAIKHSTQPAGQESHREYYQYQDFQ